MDRSTVPDCFFCFVAAERDHEKLTIKHVLVECLALENLRLRYFPMLRGRTSDDRLLTLLGDSVEEANLKNYLKDLKIYNKI